MIFKINPVFSRDIHLQARLENLIWEIKQVLITIKLIPTLKAFKFLDHVFTQCVLSKNVNYIILPVTDRSRKAKFLTQSEEDAFLVNQTILSNDYFTSNYIKL